MVLKGHGLSPFGDRWTEEGAALLHQLANQLRISKGILQGKLRHDLCLIDKQLGIVLGLDGIFGVCACG
jgi:hypothetical protein